MILSNNTPGTNSNTNVNVSITVGDIQVQFNGSAESILRSVINFMTKQVPTIDLARKISLRYEVMDLIDLFSNLIKITQEGPRGPRSRRIWDEKIVRQRNCCVAPGSSQNWKGSWQGV